MVKVAIESTETPEEQQGKKSKPKPAKKSRWFLKLCLLLIFLIVAAPSAVSLTGSVPTVMQKFNPKLADAVSFGSVKMHWWAPVEITSLKVLDLSQPLQPDTQKSKMPVLCEIERITTIEPLWRIALNSGRGTGIVVKSPRLTLIADDRGTNLDRTLAELFGESTDTSNDRFPFRVTIENGAVQLRSGPTTNVLELTPTSVTPAEDSPTDPGPSLTSAAEAIAEVTDINGAFSTMDTSRWLPAMKLSASIRRSASEQVAKRVASRPTRIAAGLDELVSDFPDVPLEDLVGTDPAGDRNAARIQIYLQPRADDKGRQAIQVGMRDVDLRLVQPFLSMLGIDGSSSGIISGGIDARLAGAELKDGLVGKIMLAGDNVRIRQSQWAADEWLPLGTVNANGAIAIAEDGMLIQGLIITTDVAELSGSGELRHKRQDASTASAESQEIELKGTVDLAGVTSSLRHTLGLYDDVTIQRGKLAFQAHGSANTLKSGHSNDTVASSRSQQGSWEFLAHTDGVQAMRAGKPLKVDPNLKLEAAGPFANGVPDLHHARLTAEFGTIDCVPDGAAWKISGLVQPESLWQTLQQFADVTQPGIRGDVNFQTLLEMQHDGVRLTRLQLNSTDVRASSSALAIMPSNPVTSMLDGSMHVEGSGAALRTLMMPWFDASFLAERSQVVADLTASPKSEIQLKVKIAPASVAAIQRGNVRSVSQVKTQHPASMTSVSTSVFEIDEADVNLNMTASNNGSQFDISNGTVKLPGLSAQVTGSVSVPDDTTLLDLTADTSYDLDVLSQRLFAADSGLAFSGQGRDVFKLKGNPAALSGVVQQAASNAAVANAKNALEGSGALKWASANIWGLGLGGAAAQATLENNLIRTTPIQCALNGGQLNAMAQYDIATSRLQLGSGSRVENVNLTPELCRQWLGYVTPMMADAADVNGQLSMRVERFFWDLNVPQNSDVAGQLTIHQAEATPGSSLVPLLQAVDLLRNRDQTSGLSSKSLKLPAQTVPIQVRQGYVIHEGLIMDLAGYRLNSSGAVGLNEQIQITLEVPLEKATSGRDARTIKVPLRGTLKSPQPDVSALLQNLGTQQLQEKLGVDKLEKKLTDEVDQTLNKGLNKLLNRF